MQLQSWYRGIITGLCLAVSAGVQAGGPADFDFWVGRWALTWGEDGVGANVIEKILDGKIVRESFTSDAKTGLTGISMSAYDAAHDRWAQTWVDNSGAYLDFTGGRVGEEMILSRRAEKDGETFVQRMVWTDIRANELTWHWQRSTPGGGWKTLWTIHYRRVEGKS